MINSNYPLKSLAGTVLMLLFLFPSQAQDVEALNAQRDQIIREIKATNQLLTKSKQESSQLLHQFQLIQNQISNREKLISNYNIQIKKITNDISFLEKEISEEKQKLDRIKQEYGKLLQQMHRSNLVQNRWLLLLSSANFNQAMARWQYFKQISNFRKNQKSEIELIQTSMQEKQAALVKNKQATETKKQELVAQKAELSKEKSTKDQMIQDLKKDIQSLNAKIAQKEKERKQLNDRIASLISNKRKSMPATPSTTALSSSFEKNKGKLPWPTQTGTIVKKYGKQAHALLKNIQIENDGIDIQTDPGATVRSIFEGTVLEVVFVKGFNMVVLVNHGSYTSVYSNLSKVFVTKNQKIDRQEALGIIGENGEGLPILHLEVWRDTHVQNPTLWIKNK